MLGGQIVDINIYKKNKKHGNDEGACTQGSTRRKRLSAVRFGSIDLNNSHKVHEDAEVIDYDPPHRTPPIHNRKIQKDYEVYSEIHVSQYDEAEFRFQQYVDKFVYLCVYEGSK